MVKPRSDKKIKVHNIRPHLVQRTFEAILLQPRRIVVRLHQSFYLELLRSR